MLLGLSLDVRSINISHSERKGKIHTQKKQVDSLLRKVNRIQSLIEEQCLF